MKLKEIIKKYWVFGAILGALLPWALSIINKIPGITITQSTIALNVADVNTGLAGWLFNVFGANIGFPEIIMSAIGGILFVVLGAYVVNITKLDKTLKIKTKVGRIALIVFTASLVSGWLMDMSLALPGIAVIVSNVIGSVVLAFILVTLDNVLKLKLVPE